MYDEHFLRSLVDEKARTNSGVSMTLLQFFWGALIVKQLKKLLAPPPDSDGSRYAQHQEEVKVLI